MNPLHRKTSIDKNYQKSCLMHLLTKRTNRRDKKTTFIGGFLPRLKFSL